MPPPAPDARTISVIYVDDEPALLEIGKLFLEKTGEFIVATAESAEEAILILDTQPFDAIISDYQMPGMNGIAFLKHVRSAGDMTPFIIFTGKGREEVVIQALNEGADFYLQKGGDPKAQFAELSNKVRYAVTRKRGEEALQESEAQKDAILNGIGINISYVNSDLEILWANRTAAASVNMEHDDIVGRRCY
ncbi:MAG: response regulator, partial [Methanocalculus sp. MSAO_Arc2]|uniref:response regulator n=1 Tax=Methanocalculus sp. MSAO_Arc2 TaxID=2293855 RepID=UPI000FF7E5E9